MFFSKSVMDNETKSKETIPTSLAEIFGTKDFKLFISMKALAGELESSEVIAHLTDDEAEALRTEYNRWVAAGKPKPEMPKTKDLPRITAIYRDKIFGKQKIYCYLSGSGKEVHGMEMKDGKKNYTLEDTPSQRKKLLDQALKTAEHESDVGLYIRAGRLKWTLTPKEFMEDYEPLVERYMKTIQLKTPS